MGYMEFSQHLNLLVLVFVFLGMFSSSNCSHLRPILINFGDSNSDTGGVLAGTGLPIGLPHGLTFFHRGTGRLGDGRLLIDFFCESRFSLHLNICRMQIMLLFVFLFGWGKQQQIVYKVQKTETKNRQMN
jgi:hypothetical protein